MSTYHDFSGLLHVELLNDEQLEFTKLIWTRLSYFTSANSIEEAQTARSAQSVKSPK